jgi:hypothetical protein
MSSVRTFRHGRSAIVACERKYDHIESIAKVRRVRRSLAVKPSQETYSSNRSSNTAKGKPRLERFTFYDREIWESVARSWIFPFPFPPFTLFLSQFFLQYSSSPCKLYLYSTSLAPSTAHVQLGRSKKDQAKLWFSRSRLTSSSSRMTISQEKVGKLLEQSKRPEETEEVLLAYCFRWV